MPSTAKPPPFCATTVPAVVVPSPQSMVAVKSLAVAFGLASVKVATVALLIAAPSVPLMLPRGHDGAIERSFFVTESALKHLQPNVERSEASLLLAFDTHRAVIHAVAITTYKRERKGSYELVAADFSSRD